MKRRFNLLLMIIIFVCHTLGSVLLPVENGFLSYAQEEQKVLNITAPSVLLMEASTGSILYESNSQEERKPASITKIMTLLIIFQEIEKGTLKLTDEVVTSQHAQSMTGSRVFLEAGEIQTVETLIKCIVIPSGNDACVAMAEHIAGSEETFVEIMNNKAQELGMEQTHFEDCCGLSDSANHYTTAYDIALMSRELITQYPQIYEYTTIWMEDIVHTTANGSKEFTLSSTNKLLQQYEYTTGLKTGYTSLAMHCISATAHRDGIDLIAVVLAAPDSTSRFQDAITMFNYGFSISQLYTDDTVQSMSPIPVLEGVIEHVSISYESGFTYLDTKGNNMDGIEKEIVIQENVRAPIQEGDEVGEVIYTMDGNEIGRVPILSQERVEKATYKDYIYRVLLEYLI